jgi:hypothetical protein
MATVEGLPVQCVLPRRQRLVHRRRRHADRALRTASGARRRRGPLSVPNRHQGPLVRAQADPVLLSCRERSSTRVRFALRRAICAASAWRSRTRLRAPAASARCTARCTKDSSRNSTRSASSPSTRTITSQSRRDPHSICEFSEYPKHLARPRAASGRCRGRSRSFACRPSARTATPFACASSCADSRALQELRPWLV